MILWPMQPHRCGLAQRPLVLCVHIFPQICAAAAAPPPFFPRQAASVLQHDELTDLLVDVVTQRTDAGAPAAAEDPWAELQRQVLAYGRARQRGVIVNWRRIVNCAKRKSGQAVARHHEAVAAAPEAAAAGDAQQNAHSAAASGLSLN